MNKRAKIIEFEKLWRDLDSIGLDGHWKDGKNHWGSYYMLSNGLMVSLVYGGDFYLDIFESGEECMLDDWFEAKATTATGLKRAINKYDRLLAEAQK
jgi:hypothetical protein